MLVVGSVDDFSSVSQFSSTLLSWSAPSYVPDNYPVITYELEYYTINDCDIEYYDYDTDTVLRVNVTNTDTLQYNITGLLSNTCYVFGIRAYTDNGYGPLVRITDQTMNITTIGSTEEAESGIKIIISIINKL